MSRETLHEIFTYYLNDDLLRGGKQLLDIGSRLGAFLYGAYLFGPEDCEIYGIEMNKGGHFLFCVLPKNSSL